MFRLGITEAQRHGFLVRAPLGERSQSVVHVGRSGPDEGPHYGGSCGEGRIPDLGEDEVGVLPSVRRGAPLPVVKLCGTAGLASEGKDGISAVESSQLPSDVLPDVGVGPGKVVRHGGGDGEGASP